MEGVPRIFDLIDDGIDFDRYPLILPPLERFQRELLELLGFDTDRQVISVAKSDWCHVGECIFPTAPFPFYRLEVEDPSGQPDRTLLLRIRQRLLERIAAAGPLEGPAPKKLYISRAKATRRKFTLATEAAVSSMLEEFNYHTVYLEDHSWIEQVRLVAGAEAIFGLHGAGITNVALSQARSLIEVQNPMETRGYFAVMARELGIDYTCLIGSLEGESSNYDNITVDMETLRKSLENIARELQRA